MTSVALAIAWWFLVTAPMNTLPPPPPSLPQAAGPYPTEAMCIEAERKVMPSDKSLWTEKEKKTWYEKQAASEISLTEYTTWAANLAKLNPKPGLYKLANGVKFYRCAGGSMGWATVGMSVSCDEHGIGIIYEGGEIPSGVGPWSPPHLEGKGIPVISDPPSLAPDSYTIVQHCQPVKGWYVTKH